MSALVCGKRSSSIFDDLLPISPSTNPSKRIRRFAGVSSPTAAARIDCVDGGVEIGVFVDFIGHLRSMFPQMDQQLLERVLEECGNDLDSAIKCLSDLCLESTDIKPSAVTESGVGSTANLQMSTDGNIDGNENKIANSPDSNGLPKDGPEWVELFVKEMMNASDMDDARARAARVLDVLEKSIVAEAGAEAVQSFHKENNMLKGQLEALLKENSVLKRAVAIQHERQKEQDDKSQELLHLKQLVTQYQEQLRTLEVNNYALTMHLRQAQQGNSIPGHFHPDVF